MRPKFGDWMKNTSASESNPIRFGMFVEVITRTGRVNRGKFFRLTNGKGEFWMVPPDACELVDRDSAEIGGGA